MHEDLLALVPHRPPFRFIDEIQEVDEDHIVGGYKYRNDEFFFPAHFPDNPITPGVILIETMAQIGVVAFGLFLAQNDSRLNPQTLTFLFTEANCEFSGIVRPGAQVTVTARKQYFRRLKLKVFAQMTIAGGEEVCTGTIAGMGVAS